MKLKIKIRLYHVERCINVKIISDRITITRSPLSRNTPDHIKSSSLQFVDHTDSSSFVIGSICEAESPETNYKFSILSSISWRIEDAQVCP